MIIEKTKDFTKFKKMNGNRALNAYHLRKLTESISRDNKLGLHPIVVNKDFVVIDGQHRLEAAKNLKLEIYYIRTDDVNNQHIIECNSNQKSWEIENYIDYFATHEMKEEYVRLKSFMKESELKSKALLTLISGIVSSNSLDILKSGKFVFPKDEETDKLLIFYYEFKAYVKDKHINPYSMFRNSNFTKAFRWLHLTQGFSKDVFMQKLDYKWFELKPQRTSEEWYKLLISIYNFKNHQKISEDFIKE